MDAKTPAYSALPSNLPQRNTPFVDLVRNYCRKLLLPILRRYNAARGGVSTSQWNRFYHQFELHFRGSSEHIARMLRSRYEEKITRYFQQWEQQFSTPPRALDLGCGSGEFLDMCKDAGFTTLGVDVSPQAIAICQHKGHQVVQKDLLACLNSIEDGSVHLVGLFHVIEHCSPRYMLAVFREVHRVLAPQGIFIVETPSLFSLWSGVRQFYLDPTHLRPVHPDYIAFMARYCGLIHQDTLQFAPVEHPERPQWDPLQEKLPAEIKANMEKLETWLYGPMDLAIVAVKDQANP